MSPLGLTLRLIRRGAAIWAATMAAIAITGLGVYRANYRTAAERDALVHGLGASSALDALYGHATRLDTPGGFLAWRYGTIMAVALGLWALLATTRVLRGDEELGRTDLLLAGRHTGRQLLARQSVGLLATIAAVAAAAVTGCVAGGAPLAGSLLFGLGLGAVGVVFAMAAALASQLVDTRRRASGWSGGFLAAAFVVRALGDGAADRRWLTWFSPLGWAERLVPFGRHDLRAAALLGVTALLLAAATLALRGRRDTGGAVLTLTDHGNAIPHPPRSASGLHVRLERGVVVAWAAGTGVLGLVLGFLAADIVRYLRTDPNIRKITSRYGGTPMVSVDAFIGLSLSMVGLVLGLFAAVQVVALRDEESSGRAELLTAFGIGRTRWVASRFALIAAATVGLSAIGGLGAWMGAAANGPGTDLIGVLRGSLNVVPMSLVFAGIAAAAMGLRPRATSAAAYGGVLATYLVHTIGSLASAPQWVLDLTPFAHVPPVPASPAQPAASAVLLAIAVGGAAVGCVAHRRRDLGGQ